MITQEMKPPRKGKFFMGTHGITHMIVPEGHAFPARRRTRCCNKETRAGDSVLIVPVKSGDLVVQVIFHRHHLLKLIEEMPLGRDEAQSEFDRLRARIVETRNAYPD